MKNTAEVAQIIVRPVACDGLFACLACREDLVLEGTGSSERREEEVEGLSELGLEVVDAVSLSRKRSAHYRSALPGPYSAIVIRKGFLYDSATMDRDTNREIAAQTGIEGGLTARLKQTIGSVAVRLGETLINAGNRDTVSSPQPGTPQPKTESSSENQEPAVLRDAGRKRGVSIPQQVDQERGVHRHPNGHTSPQVDEDFAPIAKIPFREITKETVILHRRELKRRNIEAIALVKQAERSILIEYSPDRATGDFNATPIAVSGVLVDPQDQYRRLD